MKYLLLTLSLSLLFVFQACKEDNKDELEGAILEYELTVEDYQWIAYSDLGSIDQLTNLARFNNFNTAENAIAFWSEAEIATAIKSVLFQKNEFEIGDTYKVSYKYYDGEVKSNIIRITVDNTSASICETIACEQPVQEYTLIASDYQLIADMNKGYPSQLDNLVQYKNFNTDPASDLPWHPIDIKAALSALLYHFKDEKVGDKVKVTYAIYDGTNAGEESLEVIVEESSIFEVFEYGKGYVNKTNSMDIYVHYMPWYESKDFNGYWGSHWTMSNQNPDVIVDGKRQIASHYYPKIGPYASADPTLVEYHLLLMKYAGIDGVLIDWYGTYDVNDYKTNLDNSNALIERTADIGLGYAIVYEDRTTEKVVQKGAAASAVEAATKDFIYIKDNYFTDANYLVANNKQLLLTFSPVYINEADSWETIVANAGIDPTYLSLWFQSGDLGNVGSGEYSWVSNFNGGHYDRLNYFYQNNYHAFPYAIGSAYPGFKDFYQQGGWGDGIGWEIAYNGTSVLKNTLDMAVNNNVEALQLVTWNDFGEGTIIEPTDEFGYSFLEEIQAFTGVELEADGLDLIFRYYQYRKLYADDELAQLQLDQVYYYLNALMVDRALELLNKVEK